MQIHKSYLIKKTGLRAASTFQNLASKKNLNEASKKSAAQEYEESYIKSDKYQFLHKSPVHTLKFQKSLPRLPIPKLEDTCKRYLESQQAITDDPEVYNNTVNIVNNFMQNEGVLLDKKLRAIDNANKHTSYINAPWTEMYLRDRRPVTFTHCPGLGVGLPWNVDLLDRVTTLLIHSLRFHRTLQSNSLTPDVYHMKPSKTDNMGYWNHRVRYMPNPIATYLSYMFKVYPFDMSQSPNLLQSTRVPQLDGLDTLERFPDSKHILVIRKGHFYVFDVYNENGELFPPDYYFSCFQEIFDHEILIKTKSEEIGVLTHADRDTWAKMRHHLDVNLGNGESLKKLDSAIFAICLDDWDHDDKHPERTTKHLVVGPNPANRWADKSISMILSRNAFTGYTFEHAWGDGVAVMRFVDEVVKATRDTPFEMPKELPIRSNRLVEKLQFNIDGLVKENITKIKLEYLDKLSALSFKYFILDGFGRADCKKVGIGPDSVMQLAIQIAHHRLHGSFAPTYESCSTAAFKHGRTETLRPLTLEMRELAKEMNRTTNKRSNEDLIKLFKNCSKKHVELTKNALFGKGWDRHMFGLKNVFLKEYGDQKYLPPIFQDPAYLYMNKIKLSTSTLSSPNFILGGFCPVTEDGYGIGYGIQNNECGFNTSSYKERQDDELIPGLDDDKDPYANPELIDAILSAMEDIKKVFKSIPTPDKKK